MGGIKDKNKKQLSIISCTKMTSKVYLVKFMLNNVILTILVKEGCSVGRLRADQEVFNYMKINCKCLRAITSYVSK